MSCFCIANVDRLASLKVDLQASLTLSLSAQAALSLHERLSLGLPNLSGLPGLPELPSGLLELRLSAEALASLTAIAQLRAQAKASLGIDLAARVGVTALARLTATLNARMSAIAALDLDLEAWIQLGRLNAVSLELTAVFQACLAASANETVDVAAFDFMAPPAGWGGSELLMLSAMAKLSATADVRMDAAFAASLKVTARLVAEAVAHVSLDVAAAASLTAGFSAIARLGVTLGIRPLDIGFPAVRAMVAANYAAMVSLAARLDIDLSAGVAGLLQLPGLRASLVASLRARVQAAVRIKAAFETEAWVEDSFTYQGQALADLQLSLSAMLAVSLSASLSAVLDVKVAVSAPCGLCDLRDIMAELAAAIAALPDLPPVPSLPRGSLPAVPGGSPPVPSQPPSPVPTPPPPAPAAPGSQPGGASTQPGAAESAGTAVEASSGAAAAGGGAGGGGGGGGGGVPATVMTAQLMCTMGMAPAVLVVLPVNKTMVSSLVAANIMDHVPLVNIMPFGMCMSPANPMVAAATAAALGVLTPMPCIPATASPWVPGAVTVLLGGKPMLDSTSKCMCNWAGVVSIVVPGQVQATIP